ncbi:MAG: hypothetical protein GC156_13085 [Actinomycetales bacterium]|nr:hypothetical protein [Actinomycetales bacterium]
MPTRDPRRWIRATLLGSALASLTLAGHTAAGGGADALGISLVVLLSALLGSTLSQSRLRPVAVLAVLLGGQFLLHVILSFTAAHGHGHHGALLPSGGMLIAHLTAAVVATVLIIHGDRLADAWLRFLSVLLGVTVEAAAAAVPVPGSAPRPAAAGARPSDFVLGVLVRRGPPLRVTGPTAH